MFLAHPENAALIALRKDGLMGNPPNYDPDSDVEDAEGKIKAAQEAKQAQVAKIKAEKEEPKKEEPKKDKRKKKRKRGAAPKTKTAKTKPTPEPEP